MKWVEHQDYGSVTFGSVIRVNGNCYVTMHDGYIRLPLDGGHGFRNASDKEHSAIRCANPLEVLQLSDGEDDTTSILKTLAEFITDKV